MKYAYFDASSGASGDMILGALLDLGIPPSRFIEKMKELEIPVEIRVREVRRASLRGLKVDIQVKTQKESVRKWIDVQSLIQGSAFSGKVKERALDIFRRLFEAEARVHGRRLEETHLHEAGADDAIIDIVGCCWLAEELDISVFHASPLNLGGGWVETSHGRLPVPAPAVGELLKDVPVYSRLVAQELVTPTGAAILSTLASSFVLWPELCYQKIGYGAGSKEFSDLPNILRVFYGEARNFDKERTVYAIETNIDDDNPQVLGCFLEQALAMGALDVFFTPIYMKKNRPAVKLTLIAEGTRIDDLTQALFRETSSIGVRTYPVSRRVLEREFREVTVLGRKIPVKVAYLDGERVKACPEFSACQEVARDQGRPVREVIRMAMEAFEKNRRKGDHQV